jgi:hypothetical protein
MKEMPLLNEKGFIDNSGMSVFTQNMMTNPQINNQKISLNSLKTENCAQNMVGRKGCNTLVYVIGSRISSFSW